MFALSIHADYRCRQTIVRGLDAALLGEAFRQADFILNHLAVGEDLAAAWSRVEDGYDWSVVARPELALDRA